MHKGEAKNLFFALEAIHLNHHARSVKVGAVPGAPAAISEREPDMGESMNHETKCLCQHCDGGIQYDFGNAGQTIVCPHCGEDTVLPSMKYFVWQDDEQRGPFDEVSMQNMILEGRITDDTLVSYENGELEWVPAKEVFFKDSPPEDVISDNLISPPPTSVGEASDDSLVEIVVNANHSFFYQPAGVGRFSVVIRLNSGGELKLKAIRLYDELSLRMINVKRAEVMQRHQGTLTRPRSAGSLSWVLATTAVVGVGEGVLSTASAQAGDGLLLEVMLLENKVREDVHFLPVDLIENIQTPLPGYWRVSGHSKVQISPQEKADWLPSAFIHNGDDFVTVQTTDDLIYSIRWSAVESYSCQSELDETGQGEWTPTD